LKLLVEIRTSGNYHLTEESRINGVQGLNLETLFRKKAERGATLDGRQRKGSSATPGDILFRSQPY
jgi:hypothetical protein